MRFSVWAIASMVGFAVAQGVTDHISPTGDLAENCSGNFDGHFEISVVEAGEGVNKNLALQKRDACSGEGILVATLNDSVIRDAQDRTGYIASNYQFQFDNPPQAGALYTAGFSRCPNGSLALGHSAVFYQCRSGNFYNLYDRWWAEQCSPVHILVMPCDEAASTNDPTNGNQDQGQQVVGTSVVTTTVVIPLSDGQPQVITTSKTVYICQIGDGQLQHHSTPCTPTPTGEFITVTSMVSTTTAAEIPPPVSQGEDGQIQVTPATTTTPASVPTAAPGVEGGAAAIAAFDARKATATAAWVTLVYLVVGGLVGAAI
ncbi:hypothetical protein VTK26DRAFT_8270 [Humicola hyalothermophila]